MVGRVALVKDDFVSTVVAPLELLEKDLELLVI